MMMKPRRYITKGYTTFLAYVIDAKKEKKAMSDVPVVHDIPEVVLDELTRLPLERQVEFRINLFPGTMPIAKIPYSLAPTNMKEFVTQP